MSKDKCKQTVYSKERYGSLRGYQCSRKAVQDGYCKQHHPDNVKVRQEQNMQKYQERLNNLPIVSAQQRIERLEQQIRDLGKEPVE